MQVVAPAGAGFAALLMRLRDLGIPFVQETETLDQTLHDSSEPLQVEFLVNIDTDLRRAAVKIGFNYATKVLGAGTMRQIAFDAARNFIRYGEELVYLASAEDRPALVGPGTEGRHLCALVWAERQGLTAIVCLFNHVTYKLRLCPAQHLNYSGLRSHHVFDPIGNQIIELPAAHFRTG